MSKAARILLLYVSTGILWRIFMSLMFVTSGAQSVLANPAWQSSKFLHAFMDSPLPRMAGSSMVVWKGFFFCGLLAARVFLIVNRGLHGDWLRRGLVFGAMHWALMIPWFEFYLPYNVMLEPLGLVMLECFLWFIVLLLTGIYMSFIINFKAQ